MASFLKDFMDAPDYAEYSPWFPNPLICVRDMILTGISEANDRFPWNGVGAWVEETWEWTSKSWHWDTGVFLYPLLFAIMFTILRMSLDWIIFRRVPKWFDFTAEATEKFPESIWKFLVYCVTWSWAIYLIRKEDYFFNLKHHWITWAPGIPVEGGIYWLYMLQMGFYLHCAYASVFIETIRRDFVVLMLHHMLTLCLLLFSYIIRFHLIGLLVLFVLDIGDICLEFSKTVVYFKDRGGKEHWWPEMVANICFAIFTIQHIVFRLYWYPTKVIYSAMHVSIKVYPDGPFYFLFIPMLWGLYAMQVYWFKFILRLLWKILIKGEKIEDTREYEEEEGKQGKRAGVQENGSSKPKRQKKTE